MIFVRRLKKAICKGAAILLTAAMLLNPAAVFAETTNSAETTENTETTEGKKLSPNNLDFSDEKNQEMVWDSFSISTWTDNRIRLNFTLGDQGAAFSSKLDSYGGKEFRDTFEYPLEEILKAFDKAEDSGKKVINTNHRFRCVEYRKIVACVLYDMTYWADITGSDDGETNWFKYGEKPKDLSGYGIGDSMADIWNGFDIDQSQFETDVQHGVYVSEPFKKYWTAHGVKEDKLINKFWHELAYAFFGDSSCESLVDVTRVIIERLTRYDDNSRYWYLSGDGEGKRTFYFDVYKAHDMLNYVCLDGIYTLSDSTFGYYSLFEKFLLYAYQIPSKKNKYQNLTHLVKEWQETGTNETSYDNGGLTGNRWGNNTDYAYQDFLTYYYVNPDNVIYVPIYTYYQSLDDDAYKETTGYAYSFYVNYHGAYSDQLKTYNKCVSKGKDPMEKVLLNLVPGGWVGTADGTGMGQFYYDYYAASKIVSHTINGVTGEVVE